MEKSYITKLEQGGEVAAILDAKLSSTSAPQVVDYVSFAVDNIESNIERAKSAIEELKDYIKGQTSIKDEINAETAKWLLKEGVEKLEGMRISSITTYTPKPKMKLKILDEKHWIDAGFTKTTLDETEIKNFLELTKDDCSEYATLEVIHEEPKIKINKRKK